MPIKGSMHMNRKKLARILFWILFAVSTAIMGILINIALEGTPENTRINVFFIAVFFVLAALFIYKFKNYFVLKSDMQDISDKIKSIHSSEFNGNLEVSKEYEALSNEISILNKQIIKQEDSRQKVMELITSIAVNTDLNSILSDMLPKIIALTKSSCGAFYLANLTTNKLELRHAIGFNKAIFNEFDINLGEGIIGDIGKDKIKVINNIPEDTVYISHSFLGDIKPKSIMAVPVSNNEELSGIFVLSSIQSYTEENVEQAKLIRYYLGIAIGNGTAYETNQRLTSELKFQNMLIQDFNTELESKNQENTILFENTLNSIEEYAIFSIDKDQIILTWNKGAEKLLGFEASEVIGEHVSILYSEADIEAGVVKNHFDTADSEGKYHETAWINTKNKGKYYAESTIYAIKDGNGTVIGYSSVTRDITPIKELGDSFKNEREFAYKIASYVENPMIITDIEGTIKYVNLKSAELLGINGAILSETSFFDIFSETQRVSIEYMYAVKGLSIVNAGPFETALNQYRINIKIVPVQQNMKDIAACIFLEKAGTIV